MSVQHAPTHYLPPRQDPRKRSHALDTRVPGRWLVLARGSWITLVVLTLTIFGASLPVYRAQLHTPCAGSTCGFQQLTPEQVGALTGMGLSLSVYVAFTVALALASVVVCLVVSTLIVWRRSDDRMALLVALTLVTFGPIFATRSVSASPSPWQVPNECLTFLALGLLVLVFLLFPSGQFVPHWMRWTSVVLLAGLVSVVFVAPLMPNTLVELLTYLMAIGELATVVLVQLYRYRRVSSPLERQQTKWVVFGIAVPVTVDVLVTVPYLIFPEPGSLYPLASATVQTCLLLFLPLSFGFAMLRSRLWDIDVLINRTLVYGTLTAIVVGVYVLMVSILGTLLHTFGDFPIAFLATGLVAILFQPLRARLQRGVNHLMYGERDDPYAVLSRLLSRLEATLVPEKVLPTIVETVAQALKLPYVALALLPEQPLSIEAATQTTSDLAAAGSQAPDIVASFGTPTADPLQVPLVYQAETVGCLLLAARAGDTFGKADSRLLADLARQVGVAVYTVRLTTHLQRLSTGLQESRERLVTTREEERRRLRRDLHDGLGPQLSSQTLTLSAARKLLRQDPDAADRLLVDATTHAQEAIADIRRLVYALRPPALDDLGLLAALQEQLTQYHASGLTLTLTAPERLPPLPAAVEVACYRIAQEALTNVMRHAHAQRCRVHLSVDADLILEIGDDGHGFPPLQRSGIGLTSMRERAEELGGSCTITSVPDGGARVLVCLPLIREREKHAGEKGAGS
jgi:signal transduction histidine kinase